MSNENDLPPREPDAMHQADAMATPDTREGDVPPEERTMGMVCHLAALAGLTSIPFANVIGPLIVWLIKKDTMPFVDAQGKESLNFQITTSLAILCCLPLVCVGGLGFLLMLPIAIVSLVFLIIGAVKANNGEMYRYPVSLRLVK